MRWHILAGALLLELLFQQTYAADIRSLYLFKDVLKSNTTAIKTSGFNSVIMFGVGITDTGDIMYYSNTPGSSDVLVASNGAYTGGTALSDKVKSFKSGTTGINRVEICTNSANIAALMASPGPGSNTRVYKNLAALKTAWNIDAVNNNDEAIYDLNSTVTFANMVGAIGYKYSLVPYTRQSFWASVISRVNAGLSSANLLLDRVYLQCYDGGAGNVPSQWQSALGLKVVPLVWVVNDAKPSFGTTPAQAKTKFSGWDSQSALAGGGYWNDFDIEKLGSSYTDYGNVLTTLFP